MNKEYINMEDYLDGYEGYKVYYPDGAGLPDYSYVRKVYADHSTPSVDHAAREKAFERIILFYQKLTNLHLPIDELMNLKEGELEAKARDYRLNQILDTK